MSFPLMPASGGPRFRKGELVLRDTATVSTPLSRVVNIGESSEDRWVVLMAVGASGGGIGVWSAPLCNGVAMTQIVQDGATGGSDGQRGAIWVAKVPQGATATFSGALAALLAIRVFTLTGVRNPITSFVTAAGDGASLTIPRTPGCAIFYAVDNFGSLTSITNMTITAAGGSGWFGVDYIVDTTTTVYTIVRTSLFLNRFVSWAFDY